jgi:hypothetical protein
VRLRHLPRFIWSWCRADLVGHTVCRVVGHVEPTEERRRHHREMLELFALPPGRDAWDVICERCGTALWRMMPRPGYYAEAWEK